MEAKWQKLGLSFTPSGKRHPKLLTHAANPLAIWLEGDVFRVYYSGRDEQKRSSVGAVDINVVTNEVVREFYSPFFEHGPEDSFYADGVSIGNCYRVAEETYMLFMGWQNPPDSHWRGDIGRLILKDDWSLSLLEPGPFLGATEVDPLSLSYPWVLGDLSQGFEMWYGSTISWDAGNGEMLHGIKFATSDDGHKWVRKGIAVPYEIGRAQAFSRPTLLEEPSGRYRMWFSCRSGNGDSYRIGAANSADGLHWSMCDPGIEPSSRGWDSDMIEYPYVFRHKEATLMFYNGNDYGASGFGLATLK